MQAIKLAADTPTLLENPKSLSERRLFTMPQGKPIVWTSSRGIRSRFWVMARTQ
jgi:hypothetical protein